MGFSFELSAYAQRMANQPLVRLCNTKVILHETSSKQIMLTLTAIG